MLMSVSQFLGEGCTRNERPCSSKLPPENVGRSGFVPEACWVRPAAGVSRADNGACLHAALAPGERVPSSVFWGPQETGRDRVDIILGSSQENIRYDHYSVWI